MNKELVKKYKAEFLHWLSGGNVLIKTSLGWTKVDKDYGWSSNVNVPHLIDDEYIEFRKAAVEDKTIQANYGNLWVDIECPMFLDPVECYRIKPENNFKVNDYVRNKDKQLCEIFYIDKEEGLYDVYNHKTQCRQSYKFSSVEPWGPEAGDLCWFSDSLDKEPIFSRFNSIVFADSTKSDVSWYYAEYSDYNGKNYYKHCQPFIGYLPKGFKE